MKFSVNINNKKDIKFSELAECLTQYVKVLDHDPVIQQDCQLVLNVGNEQ